MAKVSALGLQFDVDSQKFDTDYPCFDSNYMNLTWNFIVIKQYSTLQAQIADEAGMKSEFADRDLTSVSYLGTTVSDMLLTKFSRTDLVVHVGGVFAKYSLEFKKEDA